MTTGGASIEFYKQLPELNGFAELGDINAYHRVPEDWVVVITGVIGSTSPRCSFADAGRGGLREHEKVAAARSVAPPRFQSGRDIPRPHTRSSETRGRSRAPQMPRRRALRHIRWGSWRRVGSSNPRT